MHTVGTVRWAVKKIAMSFVQILSINLDIISAILQILSYFVRFIRHKCKKRQFEENADLEIIFIINMFSQQVLNWLSILTGLISNLRRIRNKRRLFKPHLLLQLLQGYRWISLKINAIIFIKYWLVCRYFWQTLYKCRSTMTAQDVWGNLEKDWNNFFWLTGETPETLAKLVNQIRENYFNLFYVTSRSKLSFRNQVTIFEVVYVAQQILP